MNKSQRGRSTSDIGEATRAGLLQAGRVLFASYGFDGASIRAITQLAGANLGAVTYHFESKSGLYEAVLEEALGPLERRVTQASAGDGSARDRMKAIVNAYFTHLSENPDLPQLLLQEVAAGKQPPRVVLRILGQIMAVLQDLHAQGIEDNSIRPGDPVLIGLSVIAQPIYLSLVSPMLPSVAGLDLSDPATRERVVTHATDFVDAGLNPASISTVGTTEEA